MRSSIPLYNTLALDYDDHFRAAHRRAYDDLAWEIVQPLLPVSPGRVIDAGCGVGRWAERLIGLDHQVLGIEQSPVMAAAARARLPTGQFTLIEDSMETAEVPADHADLVLALGSVQYTHSPEHAIQRFARWTQPGGWVVVLVDSLVALEVELLAADKFAEAAERLRTQMGVWTQGNKQADHHLFNRDRLEAALCQAGLEQVRTHGLLVGASVFGRDQLIQRLTANWDGHLALERQLAISPELADLGKQLLAIARRP
jgi:SAM-dependent methyltransferase